jgi:4-hydroxy-3-polyprenylbenzoate decarboxylase
MSAKNLRNFIELLKENDEIHFINETVTPELEISEITDRISKAKGKALFFKNTGTDFPVLINMFGSEKRMCLSLGVDSLDDIGRRIDDLLKQVTGPHESFLNKLAVLPKLSEIASWMPKIRTSRGECQQVVMEKPDLTKLPVLTCWPHDGGPFITFPMVHTIHPETGLRNMGMYRMQILNETETGMHWHLHKNSAAHFREYRKLGKRMPVAVALGGDPVYTYCATAPLPENVDEYLLAGFLRKKKVELVKCLTCDIHVPADADFILEGYVDPAEELVLEGPFGDHTGFYSLADNYPKFHVTCITHRKDAIYPATIVGIPPQEDEWLGKATERIFLSPIRLTMLPEVLDMFMPVEGVFHNVVIVKMRSSFPGHAAKVINALWGAGQMMFNKILVAVDEDANLSDPNDILGRIAKNCNFSTDIIYSSGPMDVLDHSSRKFAYGTKIGFDATCKEIQNELKSGADFKIPDFEYRKISDLLRFVIIPLEKFKAGFHHDLEKIKEILINTGIKAALIIDKEAFGFSLADILWLSANNIDPLRDITKLENDCLLIDATSKSRETDNFDRQWPNIVTMDTATIELVDKKWSIYKIGEFIPSPSLHYLPLVKNSGAIAFE